MSGSAEAGGANRKISMAPEHKPELEKELGEIRREVIESRNLVIKTDNLLKNLHAELKMVGKRQEDFQKRQWVSSGVVYIAFAVLCGSGAVMVSSARGSAMSQERERLEKSVADLTAQLAKQKAEANATAALGRAANDAYRMMTTLTGDQRLQGIDAYSKLDASRLAPLERQALNEKAEQLRKEIGQASFERGKTAFRRNEMGNVVTEMTRFIAMKPTEQEQLDASFFLGTAYNHLRKYDQAIPLLERFVQGDRRSKTRDYGLLMLAHSYEQAGQLEKAADTARDALANYPNSEFAGQLRARLAAAKRAMNGEATGASAPPAGSPVAPSKPSKPNLTPEAVEIRNPLKPPGTP